VAGGLDWGLTNSFIIKISYLLYLHRTSMKMFLFIIMTHVIGIIYILFGVKLPTAQGL